MRKSQITMFLLLAMIIFVGLIAFFSMSGEKDTGKVEVQQNIDAIFTNTPIALYVETCLQEATQDAIYLVGMQGGRIYTTQAEGTMAFRAPPVKPFMPFALSIVPYKSHNISYAVYEAPAQPPSYPYPGSLDKKAVLHSLGEPDFPALCDSQGLNAWDLPDVQYSCIQYDLQGSRHSIQEYLERYIEKATKSKIDFPTLTQDLGYTITEGNLSVQVLFGASDIISKLSYQLTITLGDNGPVSKLVDFTYRMPNMRFKKIYELAYYFSEETTNNIFFNISQNQSLHTLKACPNQQRNSFNQECLLTGMSLEQIRDPCLTNPACEVSLYSDIIRIQDNLSEVYGKPYVFQFAIKNRPPALDFIDESLNDSKPYYHYLKEEYGVTPSELYGQGTISDPPYQYNIIVNAGDQIVIYPLALDPDNDNITIAYSGWKTPVPIFRPNGLHYIDPHTDASDHTVFGGGDINRWQQSTLYQNTRRDASITTNATTDRGYHWIRINVSDNEGLSDYQDIAIVVV
ncbi:MAG: hypothetical protein ABIG95_01295 [Candidatus Woesearchaeota archaeon]